MNRLPIDTIQRCWLRRAACCGLSFAVLSLVCGLGWADDITVHDDVLGDVTVSGRIAGESPVELLLERDDGRMELVPLDRVLARRAAPAPDPATPDEVAERLKETFGENRLVVIVDKPYVIALVRSDARPLPREDSRKWETLLRKASQFLKSAQQTFLEFVRVARVEIQPLRFPLVVLIFETDQGFDRYTLEVTQAQGLSPDSIAAFYDALSNRLTLRLRECTTFETPLHEAIHQQVFNRGILQRLAPIPVWFNEGLATGFEGDGQRVRSGPKAVSVRYARMALSARTVNWTDIVNSDEPFRGDVLAAEAYGHAWGLHWLLVTRYRTQYNALVRHYAKLQPLAPEDTAARLADVERIIGKSLSTLEQEFVDEIERVQQRSR